MDQISWAHWFVHRAEFFIFSLHSDAQSCNPLLSAGKDEKKCCSPPRALATIWKVKSTAMYNFCIFNHNQKRYTSLPLFQRYRFVLQFSTASLPARYYPIIDVCVEMRMHITVSSLFTGNEREGERKKGRAAERNVYTRALANYLQLVLFYALSLNFFFSIKVLHQRGARRCTILFLFFSQ